MKLNTVGDVVRTHAVETPDKIAMEFDGRRTSYAELDLYSNKVANQLLDSGLGQESRIAYLGKNTDRYYEIFFGAAKSGVVLVSVNWRLAATEAAYILNDSTAGILFAEKEFASLAQACLKQCPLLRQVIFVDGDGEDSYGKWRDTASGRDRKLEISPDNTCVQMYTSGTTGQPKGALLRHRGFFTQRVSEHKAGAWGRWTADDVNLVCMPVFHIGGSGWGFITFFCGGTNIIHSVPNPELIARDLSRCGITKMFLVPTVLQAVVDNVRTHAIDVSSLKDVVYGASPISEELLRDAVDILGCHFIQQYGMTEATGAVTYLPPEDHDVNGNPRMASCGKAFPGIEIKICDECAEMLAPGEVGEIWIRTPAIMAGYWHQEAESRAVLVDGWYRSGDAGYLDEDGYLYLRDRIKDMIVSGGENIYPAEIERVLNLHPGVRECAVIGVPDKKWGEAVKAVVVPGDGQEIDAEEIKDFLRGNMAGYKVPKTIDLVLELPRNAAGKVLKTVLREPYWRGRSRMVN